MLREAPNAAKAQVFAALQNADCETPDLCQLKQLCVAGYQQHLHGLSETARAKALLANGADNAEAAQALDTARGDLSRAAAQIAQCADAEGAVQRKYKP